GMASPSIDAQLINRLGMGVHTRRTPIWGLGCAGGVAGLARADEYVRAFPTQRALLVGVELCSITFQWGDLSKRNIIAASLFGDGACAVLVEGDACAHTSRIGYEILGTQSTLWPDTQRMMGWDIVDTGMQVVFSARIPGIVQELMPDNVSKFLAGHGLHTDDIAQWVLHPGGAKVIHAYQQALGIDPERLDHSREVLRQYGNMSSATVFFVLDSFMQAQPLAPGQHALLAVLGPGFSCELALVRGT
ncbi:MAG: type III polyketide synthase, partial [Chloroflexales bacterium]|nr:type III polyketide synthase [Chloroflexales bacterium]